MKLRELLLAGTFILTASYSNEDGIKKNTKEKLVTIFMEEKTEESESPIFYKFDSSEDFKVQKIDSADIQSGKKIIVTRHFDDKEKDPKSKKNPLFMNGTPKYIGEFLGYNQAPNIMKDYNNSTVLTCKPLDSIPDISFPLIYDELSDKIPHDLDSLLSQEKFTKYKEKLTGIDSLMVVAKQDNGKYSLSYYVDGKLLLATYSSIGGATKKGLYDVEYKSSRKRSSRYDDAPMPYSLYLYEHVFIHQGLVNGQKISHGCIRIPGLYQEILFHNTKTGTKVLIEL